MNGLRYVRFWYLLGVALTLVVIVSSLVPPRDLPPTGMNDKVEHIVAYGGLALCFGGLIAPRRYLRLGLLLLALGGGMEIAQALMGLGRMADWHDFYADAFGTALGLALCLAGLRQWAHWAERWLMPR